MATKKTQKKTTSSKKTPAKTKTTTARKSSVKSVPQKGKKRIVKSTKKPVTKKRVVKKQPKGFELVRAPENPIICPKRDNDWEAWQTFNPGVVLLDDKIHFLYRAIGEDGLSRLGYAVSTDGFTIDERLAYPVYEHRTQDRVFNTYSYFSGGSWGGAEDPRIVQIEGEDVLYVTYTACDNGLCIGLTSIAVDDFLHKTWKWKSPVLLSPPGETHKNWVIFPEKIHGKYAILHSFYPRVLVDYVDSLDAFDGSTHIKSDNSRPMDKTRTWDSWFRGVGPAPIKTDLGWLVLYQAMDYQNPDRYRMGAVILDTNDPTKILYRSNTPVFEPGEPYENNGYKWGVVYSCGAVVRDGVLMVYYGCSDSYIGVAYANLDAFLDALKKETTPRLTLKTVKKK